MSNPSPTPAPPGMPSREEYQSALFSAMIWQQSQMTIALLGQGGAAGAEQVEVDLQGARVLIDQLEMLEVKTRGNLTAEESGLLRQNLTNLRLLFVRAMESEAATGSAEAPSARPTGESATATASRNPPRPENQEAPTSGSEPGGPDDHRPRFSKKY